MARTARTMIFASFAMLGLVAGTPTQHNAATTLRILEKWKAEFAKEAAANGVKGNALSALAATKYSTKTISADRNQKSFKLSLNQFMAKRGGKTIASRGRA